MTDELADYDVLAYDIEAEIVPAWIKFKSPVTSSVILPPLPMLVPWIYHPPTHPPPSVYARRWFHAAGGTKKVGEGSAIGSCKIAV